MALESGLAISGIKGVVLRHNRRWGQTRGNQKVEKGLDSIQKKLGFSPKGTLKFVINKLRDIYKTKISKPENFHLFE